MSDFFGEPISNTTPHSTLSSARSSRFAESISDSKFDITRTMSEQLEGLENAYPTEGRLVRKRPCPTKGCSQETLHEVNRMRNGVEGIR